MSEVYDHVGSLERMGDDEQLFRDMVGFLVEDGPRWWGEIQHALTARDTLRMHRAAHTLKGLVSNFGALRAVDAAARVERLARTGEWESIEEHVPELGAALTELLAALQTYARSAKNPTT